MLSSFKQLIEDAGGFVHPALELLIGDDAQHGQVSLIGVLPDERSLFVPWSLAESRQYPGPWMQFLAKLGYAIYSRDFEQHHSFASGFMPLIGAANHNPKGGKLVETNDGLTLHGIDFKYSGDPAHLARMWGIHGR